MFIAGMIVGWAVVIWAIRRIIRERRSTQLLKRVEAVIRHRSIEGPLLTEEEIREFHSMRWAGD